MFRFSLLLVVFTLLRSTAPADESVVPASFADVVSNTSAPVDLPVITKQDIEKEQGTIQTSNLSDTQKPECEARLTKGINWLQSAEEETQRALNFESQAKTIPDVVGKLKTLLSEPSPEPQVALPADATVVQLETQLTEIRQKAEALAGELEVRKKEAESRTARSSEIAKELIEVQQRIETTQTQVTNTPPTDAEQRSIWYEQTARLIALIKQRERLQAERRYLDAAAELLPLKRDQVEREWKTQQKTLKLWQSAVESWRKQESKRQADVARANARNSHPALRALAEENAAIAEARTVTANGIAEVGKTTTRLKATSKTLDTEFDDLRQKVAYAGATSSTGVLLRKKRAELPTEKEFEVRDNIVQTRMPQAHLQLMEWKKLQREVSDPNEATEQFVSQLGALVNQYGRDQVVQVVSAFMTARHELLKQAIPDQETYLNDLNELDLANQALHAEVTTFREYLDQRVLWMRSDEVLHVSDLRNAGSGILTLASPRRWAEVARVGFGDIARKPAICVGVLAVLVLIVIFRARMLEIQQQLSKPPEGNEPANFFRYATAFAITFLIAVRWPLVFFAIGYRLQMAAGTTAWTYAVGSACLATVAFAWGCEVFREVVRAGGMAERLFRWPPSVTKSLRGTLELTLLCGTPLVAMLELSRHEQMAELESLNRVLFIITILLFVFQIGVVLRPSGTLMSSLADKAAGALAYRLRHLIWVGTSAAPAGFALLSIFGFHYSAYQLSGRLAETGVAIIATIFTYSLAICWLEVQGYNRKLRDRHQRIAERMQQKQQVEIESTLAEVNVTIQQAEQVEPIEMHEAADHEFRQLLRYAAIATLIFGGWFIWADVLPALHVLDRVEIWQNVETIAETVTDSNGVESILMTDQVVPTTLADILKAALVCLGTIMIGRHLPGFLELTILQRLPLDQGARQAVAILVRYAATLAGILLACHLIRLSWSSVQWLAAAMTVGLGFGLQEIFANLVSGIILLFERPIRMGDLVTVGDVTGNVSKMRMRATTITDFDRRELIVPNKKFITDNVINWTLSDPISRVVLPIGVAYGTDIKHVESILMEIASDCAYVMQEPGPSTLFTGFGDSTLDLELRVFLPTREYYIEVVNELNNAIAREFANADIEIAFPQRDLHIKSVDSLSALQLKSNEAA